MKHSERRHHCLPSLLALAFLFTGTPAQAQQPASLTPAAAAQLSGSVRLNEAAKSGQLIVPLNKSQVLELDRNFSGVSVGNADVADVVPLSTRSLYVFAKELGTTSVTVTDSRGRAIAVIDVVVSYDLDGLKTQLFELIPGEVIEVRPASDGLVLSGRISNASKMQRALDLAERYAPEKVTNLMEVTGSQQVMLAVRFAEVARSVIKRIGLDTQFDGGSGNVIGAGSIGDGPSNIPLDFGSATLSIIDGSFNIFNTINALEEQGAIKTLAEPNLVALSGDTARFLAGGEFPIPVGRRVQDGGITITIEFKEFGISLSFTPTVIGDELINLELFTEVSDIDPDTSIVFDDLVIPGLEVRRARTTVELGDGQSFAIAGLLQDDFEDNVRKFPFLGDIPVLGALFRSTGYQLDQTELVVIVTPYLVTPAPLHQFTTPTDLFITPSEEELFFSGKVTGERKAPESKSLLVREQAGGIVGAHGYILR